MPRATKKKKTVKKAKKTAKKTIKGEYTWNDKDESLYLLLMKAEPLDDGNFSADYEKFIALRRIRTRFKIQEINAGRKLKYK